MVFHMICHWQSAIPHILEIIRAYLHIQAQTLGFILQNIFENSNYNQKVWGGFWLLLLEKALEVSKSNYEMLVLHIYKNLIFLFKVLKRHAKKQINKIMAANNFKYGSYSCFNPWEHSMSICKVNYTVITHDEEMVMIHMTVILDIVHGVEFLKAQWCRNSSVSLTVLKKSRHWIMSGGRDSSFGITTRYRLDSPGIESPWGRNFLHPYRLALGPTQPHIQWVPGLFFLGVKWLGCGINHPPPHPTPRLKEE